MREEVINWWKQAKEDLYDEKITGEHLKCAKEAIKWIEEQLKI
jgi:HEPN domain-containing protein